MAAITSKQDLFDHCKRLLGDPVVQINVTVEQIDDAWSQALEFYREYHPNGQDKWYIPHIISGTQITVSNGAGFQEGEFIKVTTADYPKATIRSISGNVITIGAQDGNPLGLKFLAGDNVIGLTSGAMASIVSIAQGDLDNRYVSVDRLMYGITDVYPMTAGQSSSSNLFNLEYQLRLNQLGDLSQASLAYYVQTMTNLSMLSTILNGKPLFRFNRMQGRVYIDTNWSTKVEFGDWLLIEGYKAIDPEVDTWVYADPWLVKYMTASIKRQWGMNMKKYQGMQLPGGVTVDGQSLYDEGVGEMKEMEDDLIQNGAVLEFQVG